MEPKGRLGVDKTGMLVETNQVDIAKMTELAKLKGEVMESKIVLQPLPAKETTVNGIILPASQNQEFRCAVLLTHPSSKFKRGDVVMLKQSDFPMALPVDYCEGHATLVIFESFIWYKYDYRIED